MFAFHFRLSKTYSINPPLKSTLGLYIFKSLKQETKMLFLKSELNFLSFTLQWQNESWSIGIGTTICISREIYCLPHAGFLIIAMEYNVKNSSPTITRDSIGHSGMKTFDSYNKVLDVQNKWFILQGFWYSVEWRMLNWAKRFLIFLNSF